MIFASVGSMLPFDRFVRAIDEWARDNPDQPVFVQIGGGDYEPRHAPYARMVPLSEYRERLNDCDLFVAHMGMGSILQALEARKQMLLLPREFSLGEHTTDHQAHTARRFRGTKGMEIADSVEDMHRAMSRLLIEPMETGGSFSTKASPQLIGAVSAFLADRNPAPPQTRDS